ncbi:salutaridine reductase-like [Juglans microcarpa x Juglans regia]|uniref:salutaridine reductase-like n=1 Tax=Juglans microcarpa x Juglans regia TaxID=2249226 RepID=UPI001B7E002B|nr:salutaridine reductase-like [Juglans microcarpa x Juglans regia]
MKFSAKESEVPFSSHSMMISSTRRWWSKETVAVVTGANKGIGFAFAKRLAKEGLTVILTARDFERGRRAAQELSAQGLHVHFLKLDVSDPSSINTFVSLFRMKFGALDILVSCQLASIYEIDGVVSSFLEHVKKGTWESEGWPELWTDYAVSKLALNAYTRVLAKRLEGSNLSVNCFCPGFTQTSMTRGKGTHTADDAANVGARLLLLPPEELPTGKIFLGGSSTTSSSASVVNSKL